MKKDDPHPDQTALVSVSYSCSFVCPMAAVRLATYTISNE